MRTDVTPRSNPDVLAISLNTSSNVSCNGMSDGSATFLIASLPLLGSYDYNLLNSANQTITNGSSSNLLFTIDGLSADDYSLQITYHFLIGNDTQETMDFSIGEPAPLDLTLDIADINCLNATGSITLQPSGGSGPYLFDVLGGLLNLQTS
ncbi:MAG: hypothetical protein KDC57_01920, partial [Saprospiraceae bacterium]|nr:hypothetical protein [Saprospiraceae bacterium]